MKSYWKEKYIGKIIGGYLQDSFIYIHNTDNVVIVKNREIICYVNGDTVIEYVDKSQTQKKKLGKSLVGDMIFGTAGALAFGNENQYILEITWNNNKKSLIIIEGDQFYAFFISKLYEKAPIKEKSQEEIFKEQNEFIDKNIEECNAKLKNLNIDIVISDLIQAIPYYRFRFNDCDILDYDYKISEFSKDIKEYEEFLKNNDLNNNSYINNYRDYREKYDAISKLKMIKSGNLLAKKMYENDESLKAIDEKEYEKYKDYDGDELSKIIEQEFQNRDYQKLKTIHEKNGYIYFYIDKNIQQKQLENIKDKLPDEIYAFLLKILETYNSESTLTTDYTPHNLISKIVNSFFGKYFLTNYGYDGGLLQIIEVSPSVKKHLDKLIEIGDDDDNSYFNSLDVSEHSDYFDAYDIYLKYELGENIEVKVNDSINSENSNQKEKNQNLYNGENLITPTDTYQLLETDDKWKDIKKYLETGTKRQILKTYCPLKTGGIVICDSFTIYHLKYNYIPNISISFTEDWSEKEKQDFIEKNNINQSLVISEIYPDIKIQLDNFKEEDTILFCKKEILEQAQNKEDCVTYKTEKGNEVHLNPQFLEITTKLLNIKEETFIGRISGFKIIISNDKGEIALILPIRKY